jgi:hypothetical protein
MSNSPDFPVIKGQVWRWKGMKCLVQRVAIDGSWADLRVFPLDYPRSKYWPKRMDIPFPDEFVFERESKGAMHTFLVTVKTPKVHSHDPSNKKVGKCPFSDECTDSTGQHHTGVLRATDDDISLIKNGSGSINGVEYSHITRIEKMRP